MTNYNLYSQPSSCQLLSLLIDPVTYPKHKEDENRIRLITFALFSTDLLSRMKDAITNPSSNTTPIENILFQLAIFFPPYYYSTSLLIEKYQKKSSTKYLTRPILLRMITVELLTKPFLLDNLSSRIVTEVVIQLPLKDILDTVASLFFDNNQSLDDMAVAGLLMNITELSDIESGKYLDGSLVSPA